MREVPENRICCCNQAPAQTGRDFVLYWMIAFRRFKWNFALQRAIEWAEELGKPLVILEALRCGHEWACDRFHSFVIEGMRDNARAAAPTKALYYPYLESRPGEGKGLLESLGTKACVVVTDDYPSFFLPRMVSAAGQKLPVRLERVDSNGILPLGSAGRTFTSAYSFRRFLQKGLKVHLTAFPAPAPLLKLSAPPLSAAPEGIADRWPSAQAELLSGSIPNLQTFPIDHAVAPSVIHGGTVAAESALDRFLDERLARYPDCRNHPDEDCTSGLSPYLHFGHLSAHQVFSELMLKEGWSEDRLSRSARGNRSGWWGVSEGAEAFLDQLVTWRELGFAECRYRERYDRYTSLPEWALKTLADHAADERPSLYPPDRLEAGLTQDKLWNAAQRQLAGEGRMHNYLRMLWGKKILEWSASPEQALKTMIHLNNKYALDGRDPNSYSGIFWILGRYDRPWGPERGIFGKIRYMSSTNTARKLKVQKTLKQYS